MTRRRCSRFASAKVRLFRKLAKGCERFFKKMKKKECRMDNKRTGEGGYTLLYNIYRRPTPACPRVAMGIAPLKGHESIFNTFSKGPFRPGREGGERGEWETESGKLTAPPPSLRSSSPNLEGQRKRGAGSGGGREN